MCFFLFIVWLYTRDTLVDCGTVESNYSERIRRSDMVSLFVYFRLNLFGIELQLLTITDVIDLVQNINIVASQF